MMRRSTLLPVTAGLILAVGCGGDAPEAPPSGTGSAGSAAASPRLGPADGHDLPRVDLERVALGELAPDFTLASYRGDTLTLSELRGEKEILLVFYRGHW